MSKSEKQISHYPSNIEERLDFPAIRSELFSYCSNEVSRHLAERMRFVAEKDELDRWLSQLREMISIMQTEREIPHLHYPDLRDHLKGIRPEGSYILTEGLAALAKLLQRVTEIQAFFRQGEQATEAEPPPSAEHLDKIVDELDSLPELRRRIHNLIDEEGNIKDNASSTLRAIRQDLRTLQGSIAQTMQTILRDAQEKGWVEKDVQVAVREGKLLLPIHPGAKRDIKGIVYDESATGKTLYIEPEQVVETNNRIKEKQGEEKREILRLLRDITIPIRTRIEIIRRNCTLLGILDFAHAKALLAQKYSATVPCIGEARAMEWYTARHPLLEKHLSKQGKKIVPLDVTLESNRRILLISGPNAGGKSMTLKTVGLLQYMLQCGLAIPVADHSVCCLFEQIFIDMGDDQSYENDVSTYSSHLLNMKYFCRRAGEGTLILIDEFGSGTEPTIGGAIAEAVLDQLLKTGCMGIINTHYGNLKKYGESHEGIINGAMLFDRQKIEPLYKLFIGQPGSSFAVEIARKIGLPAEILKHAESLVGADYMMQDKYIQDILRDKKYWEEKRAAIRKKEKEIEKRQEELQERINKIKQERAGKIASAEKEALQILSSANASVEKTIRKIKESQADKETTLKVRSLLNEKRKKLESKLTQVEKKKEEKYPEHTSVLRVGDSVSVRGSKEIGEIISIEKKKAKVRLGSMLLEIPLSTLSPSVKKATKIQKTIPSTIIEQQDTRRLNFSPRLDIRGRRVDEALQEVIHFIDDACRFGYTPVRILHGTGTGALRQAVRELLEHTSSVRDFMDEKPDMGGAGITVVELH